MLPAMAGEQTPAQPVIRVNVELLQVEAVVTDSKGHRAADLQPEDFQLLVDGKEKRITHFSFVGADQTSTQPRPVTPQTAGTPRREDVHRTVVFMVDDFHTSSESLLMLAPAVRRFADEQVSPGDLVSVMATRSSMGVYEQFTSEPRKIRAAMDRLLRLAGQHYDQIAQDAPQYDRAGLVPAANAYMMEIYHGLAMAAIERAIEGLRDMPGRKAIVLLSDGIEFPLSQLTPKVGQHADPEFLFRMEARTRRVVDLANRTGVVFYTFDTKQLDPPNSLDPLRRASLGTVPFFLAKETGGQFVHDTNGLSDALAKAMEDMTGYYLLGYTAAPGEFEGKRGENLNHRVRVKLRRGGLNIRTRTGFSLAPDQTTAAPQGREDLMRSALFSPFAAGSLRVRVNPVYSASSPDKKSGVRHSMLRAVVAIDGNDLRFVPTKNGQKSVVLDVAVVAIDAENRAITSKDQRYALELPEAQAATLADSSIKYEIDIAIPKPGAYQLRAAVRDDGAGTAGSAGAFVEVPDFNKERLVLSSLVLSETEDSGASVIRGVNTAARSFKIGRRIGYGFQVYGARSGKAENKPRLDMELRLFRDGVQVFASNPIPIVPDAGEKETTILGSFAVPATFADGEYTVQVIAHDRLADSKKGSASQWAEFTLHR
jgi:VWFA-related protein